MRRLFLMSLFLLSLVPSLSAAADWVCDSNILCILYGLPEPIQDFPDVRQPVSDR